MSSYWAEFLAIALAHLFAVASPGPDFAVVLRQCVTAGTRAGVWTALGVGAGIYLHVAYCILGVALLLSRSETLFGITKLIAAAYLLFLGIQAIRESLKPQALPQSASDEVSVRPWRAFGLGFLTNGLNPKATLFFPGPVYCSHRSGYTPDSATGIRLLSGYCHFCLVCRTVPVIGPAGGAGLRAQGRRLV